MRLFSLLLLIAAPAAAQVPAGYYGAADGKTGTALQAALHSVIANQVPLTYGTSAATGTTWAAFKSTDVKPDGKIWDIYSDKPGGSPAYAYTPGAGQCGNGAAAENSCYNHEHIWPRSYFGGAVAPMNSDLWIVYPTDYYINSQRGNMPYGVVGAATKTFSNGTRIGTQAAPGAPSGTCFEPVDSFKGDIARSYFYVATRYLGEGSSWQSWDMAVGAVLAPWAVQMLLRWHRLDPVSAKESARNSAVYAAQGNRNPFIDSPRYVECIWGSGNCLRTAQAVKENTAAAVKFRVDVSDRILSIWCEYGSADWAEDCFVYDLRGKILGQRRAMGQSPLRISLADYPSGLYFVRARSHRGALYTGKFFLD